MKVNEVTTEQLVKMYIGLRDRRTLRKREYEASDASDKSKQEKIEGILLTRFNEDGTESVRTASGTAYKSTKTSVSVADGEVFFNFAKENELWDLLEKRASKTVVDQYVEEHKELPPGINYSTVVTIGVRRS